jgi:hypothetical protein
MYHRQSRSGDLPWIVGSKAQGRMTGNRRVSGARLDVPGGVMGGTSEYVASGL